MRLSEILKNISYEPIGLTGDEEITHISTSVNECGKGGLLVVPNSLRTCSEDIVACDPLAVMCDGELSLPDCIRQIRVKNARLATSYAFSNYYSVDYSRMKIIGVTGTNGKTSTAAFIEAALKSEGAIVGSIGTGRIAIDDEIVSGEDYSMTTPDPPILYRTLKQMELFGCEYVVMEVSSHALALFKVDPIPFEYGVMTNLAPEHLDFHRNTEEYYKAKKRLFSMCKTMIFNIDDGYCRRAYKEFSGRSITAGALFRGDVYASCVKNLGYEGVEYLFHGRNFTFKSRLKTPGIYNVYNSMLATALVTDAGITPCKVKGAISEILLIEGRFEIIKDEVTVIIDYAHTDSAFECVLKSISEAKGEGELIAVFGAGGERDKSKRPRMARVSEKYADRIIVTSDNSRGENPTDIIADIVRGFQKNSYKVTLDRETAIRDAIVSAKKGDTVAVIGKGREKYNIDKQGYHPFDEKAIIDAALKERKRNENKT